MSPQGSVQSGLAASNPIPLSREYESCPAPPLPTNVHEWEALYGKIGIPFIQSYPVRMLRLCENVYTGHLLPISVRLINLKAIPGPIDCLHDGLLYAAEAI